jgi:hypothetical protein
LRAGADALVVKSGDFDELTGALRRGAHTARARAAGGAAATEGGVSADG